MTRLACAVAVSLLATLMLAPPDAHGEEERTTVRVGGYAFPPYVGGDVVDRGATREILDALNAHQDRFRFRFVLTAARRRYQDFRHDQFDVMLFERPEWGWGERGISVDTLSPVVADGEVYVARAEAATSQAYFDTIADKRIAGFIGYHYGFADGEGDPDVLRERFDIALTSDHSANIEKVLNGEAELAIVAESFLDLYLDRNPAVRGKLTVSETWDQRYRLGGVVDPGGPIGASQLEDLLRGLHATGDLEAVLRPFGLARRIVLDAKG